MVFAGDDIASYTDKTGIQYTGLFSFLLNESLGI